ncbi:hypothetical protein FRB94_008134 [Tulasnella sp. JGI-2019a]|nr:hypothetical protein FRB94_008134 [Tulasnella sp. JGI-2019a]
MNPLQPSFDVIDRALRISHKYDVDRLFNWGLVHLHEYPKADPRSPKYFLNKEWYKYTDPAFLVRLIQITQLLDRRDLDGHAALAYYMLSTIDWLLFNPKPVFRELDMDSLSRLTRGKSAILSHSLGIIKGIREHRCTLGGGGLFATTKIIEDNMVTCQARKNATLDALVPRIGGDFVTALSRCQTTRTCDPVASLITKGLTSVHGSILSDFGFLQHTLSQPAL